MGCDVSVTITTEPGGAQLFDGERLLGTSPAVLALHPGGAPLMLTVRKVGFLPAQRAVTATTDQVIALRLLAKPVESPPPAEPPPAPAPPPATAAASVPIAPRPKPKHHAHKKPAEPEGDHLLLQPSF